VTEFVPGIEPSRQFYLEAARPILDAQYPGLPHSAALLGRGSEVLGFDDEMSADHNWEPRVVLFLDEDDSAHHGDAIDSVLHERLPAQFRGHPTETSIVTLHSYFAKQLGVDISADIEPRDWLAISEQQLLMVTAGAVYRRCRTAGSSGPSRLLPA